MLIHSPAGLSDMDSSFSMLRRFIKLLAQFFFFVLCCPPLSHNAYGENWVDKSGRHQTEAEFIRLKLDKVHLRKPNGRVIVVPVERLSTESRTLATRLSLISVKENLELFFDALESGNSPVVRKCLEQGVNVNSGGLGPMPPLHIAATHGYTEIVKVLLGQGANVDARDALKLHSLIL